MLRASLQAVPRRSLLPSPSRSLVSTVLLNRSWENETVTDLKQEAKKRGLAQKGNKATLITRIQEFDRTSSQPVSSTQPSSSTVRLATTDASTASTASTPPPPPKVYPKEYLNVTLPDLSVPPPEPLIQIPFLPDFWESSRLKVESTPAEIPLPKVLVVGGESTHSTSSPASDILSATTIDPTAIVTPERSNASGLRGLLGDVADDVGLPRTFVLPSAPTTVSTDLGIGEPGKAPVQDVAEEIAPRARPLDSEEQRGVWVLLGLFAGSWLTAGLLKTQTSVPEEIPETGH
ncbi:hypothetical protein OF83DRAFT_1095273 [Amylostereum chailletii]|nr:hypothetical protein OF83DRAFT_1095273 [Amylostereum chailletii]